VPLLKRREFLLATSAAAGAVIFAGCVPPPREMEGESRALLAEDLLSANDNWYATACRGCTAGCGALVRIVDGRARKIEGNPDHPVNAGKLCARGQAVVQEQYHPDRLRGPLRRDASSRGNGAFQTAAWPDALDTLVAQLSDLRQNGHAGDVALVTPPLSAHEAFLVERFATSYGLQRLSFDAVSDAPLREAVRRVFGFEQLPWFDVANARTVLSFGADFLGTWLSPVRFGREYGNFRQGNASRGHLIHVDPHFSTTAASADEWIWCRPGTEGVLALSIAQALGASGLDAYTPDTTATTTGVSPERVRHVASLLQQNQPSLVIGGGLAGAHTNGADALSAILSLNVTLDNVGKKGGVQPMATPLAQGNSGSASITEWQDLIGRMNDGRLQALLVIGGANPVHGLPAALGMRDAVMHVPLVVSFASFQDDTTALADLVLPSSLPLEQWGDSVPEPAAASSALTVQQPVVGALFDTRSAWDVLLTVAGELGGPLRDALPWPTFKDLLQDQLGQLRPQEQTAPVFWNQLLQRGGYWSASANAVGTQATGTPITSVAQPQFAGDSQSYPYSLVPFVHNTLGAGEHAHLPWLQAAPDPLTSVTWQTWVALNPSVAHSLNVQEGDFVAVESPRGRIEVPVYISPAAPPEVVAIPLGQGHTDSGRWAKDRGASPMQLLEPLADSATGALAYAATRVRLTGLGRSAPLPKLEGIAPVRQLPGQEVLKVIRV
jgi:anaerobic selenocysteine-containing dehydrogenase